MPKSKLRRAGDDLRIFKGKCFRDVNADIQEEFDEEDDDQIGDSIKVEQQPVDDRNYDEILLEAFEKAREKSSKIQLEALAAICYQLERNHVPQFLAENFVAINRTIECGFERNVGAEIKLICRIVVLCFMQLPNETEFLEKYRPMIVAGFDNQSFTAIVRSSLCKTIAVLVLLHKNDPNILLKAMSRFEQIFTEKTHALVNGISLTSSGPERQIEDIEYLTTVLSAWTFLYTLMDADEAKLTADGFVRHLVSLLKSTNYDLGIASAKTIAAIYDGIDTKAKHFVHRNLLQIIDDISTMRSHVYSFKYVSKRKDVVLFYLKNGTVPRRDIKIGNDSLVIDTWSFNIQYEMLNNVFGAANMPKILQDNAFLLQLLKDFNPLNEVTGPFYETNLQSDEATCVMTGLEIERVKNLLEKSAENLSIDFVDELASLSSQMQFGCATSSVLITNQRSILQIFDMILKRNIESEKKIAIEFVTKVAICFGDKNEFSQYISYDVLRELQRDSSISMSMVSTICRTLTFVVLMKNLRVYDVQLIMTQMKNIFVGAYPKNRKTISVDEETAVQCNALEGWTLMLTISRHEDIRSLLDNHGRDAVNRHLDGLLQSEQSEMRVVAGETICSIIEHLRDLNVNFYINSQLPKMVSVITKQIRDLGASKQNARSQHSRLQKVLSYLEKGIPPKHKVKVGKEQHEMTGWLAALKYKKVNEVIGTDRLKSYLTENDRCIISIVDLKIKK